MKKLIEKQQNSLIVCDNPKCDFSVPYDPVLEKGILAFVNIPCPKCGENLLTPEDYLTHKRLMSTVDWINRWFSWITIFYSKKAKKATMQVHVHNGVNMSEIKEQ
jgi:hypothetical protein